MKCFHRFFDWIEYKLAFRKRRKESKRRGDFSK